MHVVRRGESIWTIARRNNMDPRTLMRMNNMRPGDKLPAGKRLVVAGKGGGSATTLGPAMGSCSHVAGSCDHAPF